MEVVFSESAAGCLSVAAHKRKFTDAVSSAIIVGAAGESQSQNQEEIQKMVMESQNKERINWENMIPLEIERKDILCFPFKMGKLSVVSGLSTVSVVERFFWFNIR